MRPGWRVGSALSRHFPARRKHEAAGIYDRELVRTPEALAVGAVSRDSGLVEHLRQAGPVWTRTHARR